MQHRSGSDPKPVVATPTAVARVDTNEPHDWNAEDDETSAARLGDRVSGWPAFWCWGLLVLFLPADALVGLATGTDVTLTAIYFAPVALMAWRFGRQHGIYASLLCTASTFAGDLAVPPRVGVNQALWNALMLLCSATVIAMLAGRQREFVNRLRTTALHDQLTGLANRVAFAEALRREFARAARQGATVSVVVCDCDGFKEVNDRLGHAAGDRLLKEVAGQLKVVFRASDMICRWGGDEFTVLLTDTDPQGAQAVIERAKAHLAKALNAASPGFGISMGWASAAADVETPDSLLARADAAMYAAKRLKAGG